MINIEPKYNEKKHAQSFNFTLRYIDDAFQLNNSKFAEFVERIYPIEHLSLVWKFDIFRNKLNKSNSLII